MTTAELNEWEQIKHAHQGDPFWSRYQELAAKMRREDAEDDDRRVEAAERIVLANYCDQSANDDTPEALAAAAHNWTLLKPDWCKCGGGNMDFEHTAYYRDPKSGSHGWMCVQCHGIVQTG
jgi:hypothetical protein